MQQYRKNLGKVSLTAEGAWNLNNSYDILSIVYDEHTQHGFISRKAVPQGVDLYNKEYWMPLNVSGYADNNVIILSKKTSEASIQSYTLEEAIASIKSVGRRPGAILGFYNENNDRLDIGGRWELWQFNDTNVYNWENVDSWQNLYYNYNKFMGWFKDENFLTKYAPFPEIGCYAFVGSEFNEATVYRCNNKYVWNNTTQHAWDYVKIIVDGNVTVGENGHWFNNGEDTGIPASVKGENGKTPVFREKDNTIQYSFDNVNWITISDKVVAWFRWNATTGDTQANNVGRIQISRDNVTWTNLSGDIINNLHISRYIGTDETLPTSGIAEGTIYAKGPTYADGDTSHANPIYRLWVYAWKGNTLAWQDNGEFTSIAAGIVQETGNSETEVMSQKAVTKELSKLESEVGRIKIDDTQVLTFGEVEAWVRILESGYEGMVVDLSFSLNTANIQYVTVYDGNWQGIRDYLPVNEVLTVKVPASGFIIYAANLGFVNGGTINFKIQGGDLIELDERIDVAEQNIVSEANRAIKEEQRIENRFASLVKDSTSLKEEVGVYKDNSVLLEDGTFSNNTSGYACYKLNVEDIAIGSYIYYNLLQTGSDYLMFAIYDTNGNIIDSIKANSANNGLRVEGDIKIEDGYSYIIISSSKSKWEASADIYSVKYGGRLQSLIDATIIKVNTINVSDSTTLINTLINLMEEKDVDKKPSYYCRYEIILSSGTYNIDCSAYVNKYPSGIYLMPYTTIKGKGENQTILEFLYAGNNDVVMSNYSGLNCPYECTLENLSIVVKNIRYAIHSDSIRDGHEEERPWLSNKNITLNNVKLVHNGFDSDKLPTYKAPSAWGGGSRNNSRFSFRNCHFEATQYSAFGNHNVGGSTEDVYFDFVNCSFISGTTYNDYADTYENPTILLITWATNAKIYVSLSNCMVDKYICLKSNDSSVIDSAYYLKCDNDLIVAISTTNGANAKKHYYKGGCREILFNSALSIGTPIMYNSELRGVECENKLSFLGILLHDVVSGEYGYVQVNGLIVMKNVIGKEFSVNTGIGYHNGEWIEDSTNPILVAIGAGLARIVGNSVSF